MEIFALVLMVAAIALLALIVVSSLRGTKRSDSRPSNDGGDASYAGTYHGSSKSHLCDHSSDGGCDGGGDGGGGGGD